MGIGENKALIRRQFEHFNQRELDAAWELLSPSCFGETYTFEQYKQHDITLVNACPEGKYTILDMIAEGDKLAVMLSYTGTHTGEPIMGIPATGIKIDISGTRIVRIVDNKIAEMKATVDTLSFWQQLGVLPSLPEAIQAYNESQK